jgi:methyl-accepting chemotaxis protein
MAAFKRKQYLLPGTFQINFIIASFVYQLVIVGVFVLMLFLPVGLQVDDATLSAEEGWRAGIEFLVLHQYVWPALAVASVLMLVHALFFSHRIAGPLYRFRTVFEEVGRGNLLVSTKIRRNDLLREEADCLGQMVDSLRSKIVSIQDHHATASAAVDRLALRLDRLSAKDAQTDLAQLQAEIQQASAAIAVLRTSVEKDGKSGRNHSSGSQLAA